MGGSVIRKALIAGAMLATVVAIPHGSAARGQPTSPCGERFPAQDWVHVSESGGVSVYRAALDQVVAERFANTAMAVAADLRRDLGAFPASTLCVFGPDTALDATALEESGLHPPGARLHAAVFAEQALLFVDSQQVRLVEDAVAFGLSHIALWHLAAAQGEVGYPDPLSGAVAQWFVARMNGSLEQHHATMRLATFFNDPGGDADASEWFASRQEPIMAWNPEYQESPIGDFIADAVARNGAEILQTLDPGEWAVADGVWRAALREELLQGADESRDWVGGVLITAGVLVAAIGLTWLGRRQRRRKQVPMGEIAHVDGFFES